MSPQEELQYGPKYQVAVPGRLQIDQLLRAGSALYLKPREVPTGNPTSVYVATDYDNTEYSSLDMLRSPLQFNLLDMWTPLEIALFESSICTFGKDFRLIARHVGTKSTNECVEFYYTIWKHSHHYFIWKAHQQTCTEIFEEQQARASLHRLAELKMEGVPITTTIDAHGRTVLSATIPVDGKTSPHPISTTIIDTATPALAPTITKSATSSSSSSAATSSASSSTSTSSSSAGSVKTQALKTESTTAATHQLEPTYARLTPGVPVTTTGLNAIAALSFGSGILEATGGVFTRESIAAMECLSTEAVDAIDALQRAKLDQIPVGTISGFGATGVAPGDKAIRGTSAENSSSRNSTWSELATRTLAGPATGEVYARRLALVQPLLPPAGQPLLEEDEDISVVKQDGKKSTTDGHEKAKTTAQSDAEDSDAAGASTFAGKEPGFGLWSRLMGRAGAMGFYPRAGFRNRGALPESSVAYLVDVRNRGVYTKAPKPARADPGRAARLAKGKLDFDTNLSMDAVVEAEERLTGPIALVPQGENASGKVEADGKNVGASDSGASSTRKRRLLALDSALEPYYAEAYVDVYNSAPTTYSAMPVREEVEQVIDEYSEENPEVICETCRKIYPSISELYRHVHDEHFKDE